MLEPTRRVMDAEACSLHTEQAYSESESALPTVQADAATGTPAEAASPPRGCCPSIDPPAARHGGRIGLALPPRCIRPAQGRSLRRNSHSS